MRYLPDGAQMKEADLYTIEHIGIPSMVLMERAALQTVRIMKELHLDLTHTLIVCGSGNNGGDGFAIARLLAEKGLKPCVVFVGLEESFSVQAKAQREILTALGITVFDSIPDGDFRVVVDAVFGVGLRRNIEGHYFEIIDSLNLMSGVKVAVDLPSGVDSNTGEVLGIAFRADITVSYAFEKIGTTLFPGAEYAGRVYPVRIGIPVSALLQYQTKTVFTYDKEDLPHILPTRKPNSHKGSYGKILMITGSRGMSGAAYLSAKAAYITGAGLVKIYTTQDNRSILQQMLPEAIIETYEQFDSDRLTELLEWADVAAIGSGLGQSETSAAILTKTVQCCEVPLVVDADGLNLISSHMDILKNVNGPLIFTPHMKEMSRLLGNSVNEIQKERFTLLEQFVQKYPVTCVLKDARTLVMTAEESPYMNTSGNCAMAKAGSGDVLTGVIAGLLAQGKLPHEGAAVGVYLHGLAGDRAKDKKGCYSVLARDLIMGIESLIEETKEIENGTI